MGKKKLLGEGGVDGATKKKEKRMHRKRRATIRALSSPCLSPDYYPPFFLSLLLGSQGPGKLPEKRKSPKVVMGGCKRSFGPREQKSPNSLLHHSNPVLHRCKMGLHRCKFRFARWVQKTCCTLSEPLLGTFSFRAISQVRGFPTLRH